CYQLPDSFKDFASQNVGGKGPNKAFLAFCNREMYHAQWKIIIDDEFIDAYEHGIVIKCLDGLYRRFYPRMLTYSADYPENLRNMGASRDMSARLRLARVDDISYREKVKSARRHIYEEDLVVNSKAVEGLLKEDSLTPVE
ncbi:hypothetical protein DXG01_015352, partial [Tephrocybe rancida]